MKLSDNIAEKILKGKYALQSGPCGRVTAEKRFRNFRSHL